MSPLEAALADLRIAGSVLLHERYGEGTAIAIPDEQNLRALLGYAPQAKVAPFHLVLNGAFDLAPTNGRRLALTRFDAVICLDGAPHQLRVGAPKETIPLEDILTGQRPSASAPHDAEGAESECICGFFVMQSRPLNPLVSALPTRLLFRTAGDGAPPLLSLAREMLAHELEDRSRAADLFTRARILEIFFAEAMRAYQGCRALPVGWFRGVTDSKLAAALSVFHRVPGEAWSVQRLASCSSLSPSRFAARFREAFGVTAMEYVARWRINLACRLLEDRDRKIEAVAEAVGYGGAAALSKAFKDRLGYSPARWRARAAGGEGKEK